jgi:hypothetical protein
MVSTAGDFICLAALALIVLGAVVRRRQGARWGVWVLATGFAVLTLLMVPDFVRGFRDGWNSAHAAPR